MRAGPRKHASPVPAQRQRSALAAVALLLVTVACSRESMPLSVEAQPPLEPRLPYPTFAVVEERRQGYVQVIDAISLSPVPQAQIRFGEESGLITDAEGIIALPVDLESLQALDVVVSHPSYTTGSWLGIPAGDLTLGLFPLAPTAAPAQTAQVTLSARLLSEQPHSYSVQWADEFGVPLSRTESGAGKPPREIELTQAAVGSMYQAFVTYDDGADYEDFLHGNWEAVEGFGLTPPISAPKALALEAVISPVEDEAVWLNVDPEHVDMPGDWRWEARIVFSTQEGRLIAGSRSDISASKGRSSFRTTMPAQTPASVEQKIIVRAEGPDGTHVAYAVRRSNDTFDTRAQLTQPPVTTEIPPLGLSLDAAATEEADVVTLNLQSPDDMSWYCVIFDARTTLVPPSIPSVPGLGGIAKTFKFESAPLVPWTIDTQPDVAASASRRF